MAQVYQVNVQLSAIPENLLGPTQAPSAFPVFVQHMPANDGGPAYIELINLASDRNARSKAFKRGYCVV